MPRPPAANVARAERIALRLTGSELEEINRLRGSTSVSDYIRALVRRDAAARSRTHPEERP